MNRTEPEALGVAWSALLGAPTITREMPAAEIFAQCETLDAARTGAMPDERTALNVMMEAWVRLKELGWADAIYSPKDGRIFDAIEAGSTGVHACRYEGDWPDGRWWIFEDGDMWPSRPILWRERAPNAALSGKPAATEP